MITRIYEREYVTLDYDPSVPCIVATHLKFMLVEEFKSHLDFALDFMKGKIKETGRMLFLADTTLSPAADTEAVKWTAEDWTPRALEAGIKHVAFVLPENEWSKMSVDEYTEAGKKNGMDITYFQDLESAKNWFRDMSINQ